MTVHWLLWAYGRYEWLHWWFFGPPEARSDGVVCLIGHGKMLVVFGGVLVPKDVVDAIGDVCIAW